jgi:hypothetical protein
VIEEGPVIVSLLTMIALPSAPVAKELALTIPEAFTLVSEMFGSRLIVTVSAAADEVRFVPPAIVSVSVRRSNVFRTRISSDC